jgi:hypothetical protein
VKILFWNLGNRPVGNLVVPLAAEQDVDLLVLAEPAGIDNTKLVKGLSSLMKRPYIYHYFAPQPRLRFYSRFERRRLVPLADSAGVSVRKVTPPGSQPLILVAVHSASQRHWPSPADRWALASRIREQLDRAEMEQGHRRSIVFGDFNSDPFDDALTNSDGLHAVMTKQIASKGKRTVGGEARYFLYNPMWSLLGDASPGPPGSYFYRRATSNCRFWHLFDQVLIRADLMAAFDQRALRIVTSVGATSLAKSTGEPDREIGSDHFPLVFAVDTLGSLAHVG